MKKIYIFLGLTFLFTWSICFTLMLMGGLTHPLSFILLISCMMMPSISVLLTIIITKGSFRDVWLKARFKGNLKYYVIAWFSPVILIIFGAIVYYLIFPSHFDSNMSIMIQSLKLQLNSSGQALLSDEQIKSILVSQLFSAILMSPIVNIIACLGEEVGWRGFLLPNLLEKFTPIKATLLTGFIWGVWHAPMIAMGYNYGLNYALAPIGGILAMIVFCIFVGSLFSYITFKTKSCIPAGLSHGMLNGFASASAMFIAIPNPNLFIGPSPLGFIGGIGFIITGLICFKLISKINFDETNSVSLN